MAEANELDRNEEATPFKLQKARERGQVARSADLVSAIVFAVAAAGFYWKGWDGLQLQLLRARELLANAGDAQAAQLWPRAAALLHDAALDLLPFMGALLLAAILASLAQTGAVLSFEPLKADFTRLNPVTGARRLFSMRTLFDAGRALLKLLLLGSLAWHSLLALAPGFPRLAAMPAAQLTRTLLHDGATLALQIALALLGIALLDRAYSLREFARRMRMSRRELKDEHKQREGDPRIRARLRELRRQLLRRSLAARRTAQADVLLTNPTHVAVALRYVQAEMASPQVVAKGAGSLAGAMRKIAARHRVPVVQSPALARALFRGTEVDAAVPPTLYAEVARVLVWVFAMRDRAARPEPAR